MPAAQYRCGLHAGQLRQEYTLKTLTAFPLQQWLRERAWILRCTYIACIVLYL